MRSILALLIAILFTSTGWAEEVTLDGLRKDSAKAKEFKKAIKYLETYFIEDAKIAKGGRQASTAMKKRDQHLQKFREWFDESKANVGVDLREHVFVVLAMLDEARVKILRQTKGFSKGGISYFKIPDPKGMQRFEYSLIVPKSYDVRTGKYPLVISLHGRVIDRKHPAFRGGDHSERSRQVLFDYWRRMPAAENVLAMAPTGNPNGFKFEKDPYLDLQVMYRSMVEMLTKYRVDWDRIFLEVQGPALRVACEQAFMFAGFIVRDRVENRRNVFLPEEELFMLENLNGVPLLYIADKAHWDRVGKPMSEALKKAYTKFGVPQNLVILKGERDANGALKSDNAAIKKFVETHKRNPRRKKFEWRFFNSMMKTPSPLELTIANYSYDFDEASRNASLEKKAGTIKFAITEEVDDKKKPFTKIDVQVTEAEGLRVHLHDGIANLNLPVSLVINGEVVHDRVTVRRDWEIFWKSILPGRFFMIPYLGTIESKFPPKPQFESPKEKEDKDKEKEKGGDGDSPAKEKEGEGTGEKATAKNK